MPAPEYDDTESLQARSYGQQPREPRYSVLLSATVDRFGRSETTTHRVRNLSAHGACIADAKNLRAGETPLIAVGKLEGVVATVRWVVGDQCGLLFVNLIDLDAARAKTAARSRMSVEKALFRPMG